MKLEGKWVYLENHSMENLNKMHSWSMDKELIEIELGKIDENNNIEYFKDNSMNSYIENNHESNSPFCHFGIHRKYKNELIGYVDIQNINGNNTELSLSIPDKNYRNKHYGIDTVLTALKYAFEIRNIEIITIRTRIDNNIVINICKKLNIKYILERFTENNYDIDVIKLQLNKDIYENIRNKIIGKQVLMQ